MKIPALVTGMAVLAIGGCAAPGNTLPTVSPSEPHGVVVSVAGEHAGRVFPVRITQINGVNVPQDTARAFWLAPGSHTLRVVPLTEDAHGVIAGRAPGPDYRHLTIDVQQGRRYVLGARVDGPRVGDWEPIIQREEAARS